MGGRVGCWVWLRSGEVSGRVDGWGGGWVGGWMGGRGGAVFGGIETGIRRSPLRDGLTWQVLLQLLQGLVHFRQAAIDGGGFKEDFVG